MAGAPPPRRCAGSSLYESRTHHSNMDVFDRLPVDDMRRNAVILASMVYLAAMRDQPLPREGR